MAYKKLFTSNDGYGGKKYGIGKVQKDDMSASGDKLISDIKWYKSEKLAMKKLKK